MLLFSKHDSDPSRSVEAENVFCHLSNCHTVVLSWMAVYHRVLFFSTSVFISTLVELIHTQTPISDKLM